MDKVEKTIEKVVTAIVEEARNEARKKREAARAIAREIAKSAEEEAKKAEEAGRKADEKKAEAAVMQEIVQTKLEAKRAVLAAREKFVKEAFDLAVGKLAETRKTARYKQYLNELIGDWKKDYKEFTLTINPEDEKIVNFSGRIVKRKDMLGGAIAETENLVLDESWNSKLEEVRKKDMGEISKILFPGD